MEVNYKEITLEVVNIAKRVGEFIKKERLSFSVSDIELKGKNNFVSYVDKSAEKMIVESLLNIAVLKGKVAFITEEETVLAENNDESSPFRWIIDPLDGTTNFVHGLAPFAVSIALQYKAETVIGVVYEINLGESFYSWKGIEGVFLNGEIKKVSEAKSIDDSLFAIGFPYARYPNIDGYLQSVKFLIEKAHGARRLGSAATDLAYVSIGRFEAFYEYGLGSWDMAAGEFLVRQGGGRVTGFSKDKEFSIFEKELFASNGHIHEEVLEKVMKQFLS